MRRWISFIALAWMGVCIVDGGAVSLAVNHKNGKGFLAQEIKKARSNGNVVTENVAKEYLRSKGVDTVPFSLVKSREEALEEAAKVGFPLVAKIVSPEILHKTELGGVKLHLNTAEEAAAAVEDMYGRLEKDYNLTGVLLEKMADRKGVELIVGLQNDPSFGPTLMIGKGGITTELTKDVVHGVLPLSREDVKEMLTTLNHFPTLQGYRDAFPNVNLDALADTILKMAKPIEEHPGDIESVDYNPVLVNKDKQTGQETFIPVDAKIILNAKHNPKAGKADAVIQPENLEGIFSPQEGLAFVGASEKPGSINNSIMRSLLKFKGKLYPVNPKGIDKIEGKKTYKSVKDIPHPVDTAVVALELARVPQVMKDLGEKGIKFATILSGGGVELGGERGDLEAQTREEAEKAGINFVGINVAGVYDAYSKLDTTFQGEARMARPKAGHISFLTQSGTVMIAAMNSLKNAGVSKVISYGNRTKVDEADLLNLAGHDPNTNVIGMYVEGVAKGTKFMEVAKNIISDLGKPIVIFKNGRTPAGADQAKSHTGTLGGEFTVIQAAMKKAKVWMVNNYSQAIASVKALEMQPRPKGNRVGIVTNGAGPTIQVIDMLKSHGLTPAQMSPETLKAAKELFPPSYVIGKQVADLTGSATAEHYGKMIELMMKDPNVDIILPWFVFEDDPLQPKIASILGKFNQKNQDPANENRKPIVVGAFSVDDGAFARRMRTNIEKQGVPVNGSVEDTVAAMGALWHFAQVIPSAKVAKN